MSTCEGSQCKKEITEKERKRNMHVKGHARTRERKRERREGKRN
jgi:hypothetical protein